MPTATFRCRRCLHSILSYTSILPFKKVHVTIIVIILHWKYGGYNHFSMPTYFPPTLYIYIQCAQILEKSRRQKCDMKLVPYVCVCVYIYIHVYMYVFYRECATLRSNVPLVKLRQYNHKHIYPNLNFYRDNDARKIWSSCGSTYCTHSA
jgi:hypothetical protein